MGLGLVFTQSSFLYQALRFKEMLVDDKGGFQVALGIFHQELGFLAEFGNGSRQRLWQNPAVFHVRVNMSVFRAAISC